MLPVFNLIKDTSVHAIVVIRRLNYFILQHTTSCEDSLWCQLNANCLVFFLFGKIAGSTSENFQLNNKITPQTLREIIYYLTIK